jgi:hypothetical protein
MHAPLEETNPSLSTIDPSKGKITHAVFAWLISHQQPPASASSTVLSEQISISHQPNEQAVNSEKKAPHSPDEKKFENKKHIDHTT